MVVSVDEARQEEKSGEVEVRFGGKPWGTVRYWLMPRPGFQVGDQRRLEEIEIGLLKGIGMFHVLNSPERQARRATQRELLTELVEALWKTAPQHLDVPFKADFADAPDDGARLRVVIDQVASLTDPSAQAWHAQLVGGSSSDGAEGQVKP